MRLLAQATVVLSLGVAGVSCGAGRGNAGRDSLGSASGQSRDAEGTPSGSGGATGLGSAAGSGVSNGALAVPDASVGLSIVDGSLTDAFIGCAATTQQAKLVPLDIYFLLDTSGSMNDLVSPNRSKWQAVTAAITAFIDDPASAGIGAGVQYFPNTPPGVAASCTSSSQCGAAGPCVLNFCQWPAGLSFCDTSADCRACDANGRQCANFPCVPLGWCTADHNVPCAPIGIACGPDTNGFDLGVCGARAPSQCSGHDDCAAPNYQNPVVPIGPLPGNAVPIAMSLGAHQPYGATPTEAALRGVIAGAKGYSSAHPGHTVVVVLATDGLPDEIADATNQCAAPASAQAANAQVAQIATAGLASTPSIKTFAIGVFTPSEIVSGTTTLNEVAKAGGTAQPFIIGTGGTNNVEQAFSAALTAIRGASLPCNYEVPVPKTGSPDFFKINVRYTPGGGAASTVPYVGTASNCDLRLGGWYYNADPAAGGIPTTIDMCPVSCTALKADGAGRVDIALGCQTQTIIR